MPSSPRRHFLPWDEPLLPQAVAWLAGDWTGPAALDLADLVVVVPTRQSGRRLREALAEYAATRGAAVFPPRVLTPEALVAATARPGLASRLETLLAWVEVLQEIDLESFRNVFPIDPSERAFSWASRLAEQLVRLQSTLAENQLRISDVARRAGADFPELARWTELAQLEARQEERLAAASRRASGPASLEDAVRLFPGCRRLVLLATPDPLPAAVARMEALASVMAVEIALYAPSSQADEFDAWGRPIPARWERRTLELPEFEQRVHLCATAAEQAGMLMELATRYVRSGADAPGATEVKPPAGVARSPLEAMLGVGIADTELTPLIQGEAARTRVDVFNPEGRLRRSGALYQLLVQLAECLRAPRFDAIEALARCPDFLAYVGRRVGAGFSSAVFLAGLDALRQRHLPADLEAARRHARDAVADGLAVVDEVLRLLRTTEFPDNIATVLGEMFSERQLRPNREADEVLCDAAAEWTEILRECAAARLIFTAIEPAAWWEIALRLFGDTRLTETKPVGALELQGWLELLFEDAPHLVVAGFNDGRVPEPVAEDPFLPESLRKRLGLRTNADRLARDAYLLEAIAASRTNRDSAAPAGRRLDILFGRVSAAGDPLRPSRLLLRCADEALPARVDFLFRQPESAGSHLAWRRAWQLQPRRVEAPTRVAVTALKRWLVCPFRFYLKYALRMEAVDAAKSELDAFDFGTLCHHALQAMGESVALRDSTDPEALRGFLVGELMREADARYGRDRSLPLLIQVESARQRLAKFADLQARERAEGWVIERVEFPFQVPVNGVTISGKIDRIDRNESTGAIRVVDYKTSDSAINPRQAHLRPLRATETPPDWALVVLDGKPRVWADLQLPLYRHALAAEFGSDVALGYINLPKAVGQTALAIWDDYTLDLHLAAMRCVEGVCGAIRAGEFWPPNEEIRADNDEFAALFHHGAAESVAWEAR